MRHPTADIDKLYLPRISGGRGLIQIEATYKTTTIDLEAYINSNTDELLDIIRDHDKVRNRKSLQQKAANFKRQFNTPNLMIILNESATDYARRIRQKAKEQALEMLQSKWKEKPLHGQYPNR